VTTDPRAVGGPFDEGLLDAHVVELPHELGPVHRFDDRVQHLLDRVRGREPNDRIVYGLTELGDFGSIWLLLAWTRALKSDRDIAAALRLTGCLAVESLVVNGLVKSVFKRERPVHQGPRPHNLRIPLTTSFPSGHASSAVVAAILLSEDSKAWPLYWALAAGVASSRAYVRIHHASDVIGGAAVGLVLGTAMKKLWKLPKR
jgi:undecaprenyl-diphosphatase